MSHLNGRGEPEVVSGKQLSVVLREWERKYLAERPRGAVSGNPWEKRTENHFVGPISWLVQESGFDRRRINGLMRGEYQWVGISMAEKVLIAVNHEFMLSNDEITIVPNPNWSVIKWVTYMEERGCA